MVNGTFDIIFSFGYLKWISCTIFFSRILCLLHIGCLLEKIVITLFFCTNIHAFIYTFVFSYLLLTYYNLCGIITTSVPFHHSLRLNKVWIFLKLSLVRHVLLHNSESSITFLLTFPDAERWRRNCSVVSSTSF